MALPDPAPAPTATTPPAASSPPSSEAPFPLPPHASFPPFYTLQPNARTRASQLASWSALLTAYAAHTRHFHVSPSAGVFANPTLRKTLPPDDARAVLAYMESRGAASRAGDGDGAWVWPVGDGGAEAVGAAMGAWAGEAGMRGAVLTLYELVEGEATRGQVFHGLPLAMAREAAERLARRGKASVFGEGDGVGVKFYA